MCVARHLTLRRRESLVTGRVYIELARKRGYDKATSV
jgi:hypothetical protein